MLSVWMALDWWLLRRPVLGKPVNYSGTEYREEPDNDDLDNLLAAAVGWGSYNQVRDEARIDHRRQHDRDEEC